MRAQYIRFKEPVMSPGRGGNPISKAHLVELDDDGKEKESTAARDERMLEIDVGDHWITLRNARGTRRTHASNVKDCEPANRSEKEKKTT